VEVSARDNHESETSLSTCYQCSPPLSSSHILMSSQFLHMNTITSRFFLFAYSLAATSSSNTAEIAHASVSGSAFMLALSDPKMIDRRLGSLYDTEDWADGPDGVAMSVFQREAFLMQLALITAPQQARLAISTPTF